MSIVKLNNKAVSNATAFGSISSLGSMTFIKKLTASSSATLSFVDGSDGVVLDDTYKEYIFYWNNTHPATASVNFTFNGSTDTGSNYNATKTTTVFRTYHTEDGSASGLGYRTQDDLAQSTAFQTLNFETNNDNDSNGVGYLHLFNPSSTTFVKHFIAVGNTMQSTYSRREDVAGYFNTTNPIDAIQFKFSSGNIDAGDICLYGIA